MTRRAQPHGRAALRRLPALRGSAGTEPGAQARVTAGHLGWAEVIFVMERRHADRIQEKFAEALQGTPVVVLRIPDKYRLGDSQLVALLREKLAAHLPLLYYHRS